MMLKPPKGDDLYDCTCLVANLILIHFLKRPFDKSFLSAVVSKGCNFSSKKFFEILYAYKNRI
jgi:hypothetical protein